MSDNIIVVENVQKYYGNEEARVKVLNNISISIKKGSICTIYGPSGSGKSTLLNIIGGLDTVNEGKVFCGDIEVTGLQQKEMEKFRRKKLGFVFQMYNLIPDLTVKENIEVSEYLAEDPLDIEEIIETLGLKGQVDKYPAQLSGGQQQRCAIGRALVKNPEILLCDEPTGALDMKMGMEILKIIEKINQKYETTVIMVTHNNAIKEMSNQVITIRDGEIISEEKNALPKTASQLEW